MRVSLAKALSQSLTVEVHKRVKPHADWDPAADAVVLALSKDWFLARSLYCGIEADGYQATRKDIVQTLHTNKYLAFRKTELQATGVWPSILEKPKINLENITTILDSLRKLGLLAIVLRETSEEYFSTHCRIESVSENSVVVRGFDGVGQWEKSQTIDTSDITHVHFGSRYLTFYQNYLNRRKNT